VRSDQDAPTLICVVARKSAIVEVLTASYDSGRIDAGGICDRLQLDHWQPRPLASAP
jgi:hypothetical protein